VEILTDIIVGGASPYGEVINQLIIDLSKDVLFPDYIDPISDLLERMAPVAGNHATRRFVYAELLLILGQARAKPVTPMAGPAGLTRKSALQTQH
jgi:hypothetical protein